MKKYYFISLILLLVFLVGSSKVTSAFSETKINSSLYGLQDVNRLPPIPEDAQQSKINVEDAFKKIGDASIDTNHKNVVQIVPSKSYQKGTLWYQYQIDLTQDFEFDGYVFNGFQKGATGNETADGMTFTFHNDVRGINTIGDFGGALGAYGVDHPNFTNKYIQNALSLEIDLYPNIGPKTSLFPVDTAVMGVPEHPTNPFLYYPHAALVVPGDNEQMKWTNKHMDIVYPRNKLEQDNVWSTKDRAFWNRLNVKWDSATNMLTWKFVDFEEKSRMIDPQTYFKGTKVWWGFTASTGVEGTPFGVAIKKLPQVPKTEINKKIRNVTKNETTYGTTTNGDMGDILEYQIEVKNLPESIIPLVDTVLHEKISNTVFIPGSLKIDTVTQANPSINAQQEFDLNLGTMTPNESKIVSFQVKIEKGNADSKILNTVKITSTYSEEISSNEVETIVSPKLKLDKSVNQTVAKVGDELEYTLTLSNAKNAGTWRGEISDDLPEDLDYTNNSTKLIVANGTEQSLSDSSVWQAKKLSIAQLELKDGEEIKVKFKAKILMKHGINEETVIENQSAYDGGNVANSPLPFKGVSDKVQTKIALPILNIRQVIIEEEAELSILSKGYQQLYQVDKDNLAGDRTTLSVISTSGIGSNSLGFKTIQLLLASEKIRTFVTPIIPEYYEYTGFILTDDKNKTYLDATREKPENQLLLDYTQKGEYWVTIYLKPTTNAPRPYSLDYQSMPLGEISP